MSDVDLPPKNHNALASALEIIRDAFARAQALANEDLRVRDLAGGRPELVSDRCPGGLALGEEAGEKS